MKSSDELFNEGCRLIGLDIDVAIERFERAIEQKPDFCEAHANLGMLLQKKGMLARAEAALRISIAIRPTPEALSNLADLLAETKRFFEAEACYKLSLALNPLPATFSNYAVLLACLKREAEAEACFRRALALSPDNPHTRFNYAYLLLRQGRFEEGWPNLEARHQNSINVPDLPFRRWQGESAKGKSFLIWPELGLGDEIQFSRYVPKLKKAGASRIVLVCREPLLPLLETLEGVDEVRPASAGVPEKPFDFWTMPLALPGHFGTQIDSAPYLFPLQERIEKWRGRITGKKKIGLVWKGNPQHENDECRSLASLSMLAPLWEIDGISFYSLQKGEGEREAEFSPLPLVHLGGEIVDFADSAAILSQLDLVISVDTAIVHLAGSLGIPCWVLLPEFKTDWRWLKDGTDSPWYPSLRLFRQKDGWESLILEVREALRALP